MKNDDVSRVSPPVVAPERLDLPRKPQRESSRHTSGPWQVGESTRSRRLNRDTSIEVQDARGQMIALLYNANREYDGGEDRANARLIAAAPALLAALQDITFRFAVVCAATGEFDEANAKALDAASVAMQHALGEA